MNGRKELFVPRVQAQVDEFCDLITSGCKQFPELLRWFQRELSLIYPEVYWTIDSTSGRLRGHIL